MLKRSKVSEIAVTLLAIAWTEFLWLMETVPQHRALLSFVALWYAVTLTGACVYIGRSNV